MTGRDSGSASVGRDHALEQELPMAKKSWVHFKMSDEKAMRILPGLRASKTLREVGEAPRRLEAYCAAHPEYAGEARLVVAANALLHAAAKVPGFAS